MINHVVSEASDDFFENHCKNHTKSILKSWINPRYSLKWHDNIDKVFQKAHFFSTDNVNEDMSLSHVYPYELIHLRLQEHLAASYEKDKNNEEKNGNDDSIDNYSDVKDFLRTVFQEDYEAFVYVPGLSNTPITSENGDTTRLMQHYTDPGVETCYLDHNQEKHQTTLREINEDFLFSSFAHLQKINYAKELNANGQIDQNQQKINCENTQIIMDLANSAPANLRFGDAKMNKEIDATLDPMGSDPRRNAEMTWKERKTFLELLDTPYEAPVERFRPDGINSLDGFYVRSSSGFWPHRECTTKYYVKCPKNDDSCTDNPE